MWAALWTLCVVLGAMAVAASTSSCFRSPDVSGASPSVAGRVEEGSDIEVITAEPSDDVYFEDDPMELSADGK